MPTYTLSGNTTGSQAESFANLFDNFDKSEMVRIHADKSLAIVQRSSERFKALLASKDATKIEAYWDYAKSFRRAFVGLDVAATDQTFLISHTQQEMDRNLAFVLKSGHLGVLRDFITMSPMRLSDAFIKMALDLYAYAPQLTQVVFESMPIRDCYSAFIERLKSYSSVETHSFLALYLTRAAMNQSSHLAGSSVASALNVSQFSAVKRLHHEAFASTADIPRLPPSTNCASSGVASMQTPVTMHTMLFDPTFDLGSDLNFKM